MKLSRQLHNNAKFLPNSGRTSTENFVNWNVNDLLSSKDGWIWSDVTQFHNPIFCHLTAILTKKMTDLFPFSIENKKQPTKTYFSWNKISSLLASKPTCTSIFPWAAAFALLQPQFIKMKCVLLKLPHQ